MSIGIATMRHTMLLTVSLLAAGMSATSVIAHSGGLNAQGCHNNRQTGEYHCHRNASAAPVIRQQATPAQVQPSHSGAAFRNCSAARAAGAAPVYAGQPGYGLHLDRDRDGVGCE